MTQVPFPPSTSLERKIAIYLSKTLWAVGCFRRAGFHVVADPVDFQTSSSSEQLGAGQRLTQFDEAAKEWIGLVVYRIFDRKDAIFPDP
jgi:hypothetical protein